MKKCKTCGKEKDEANFYQNSRKTGLRTSCKECWNKKMASYARDNKDRTRKAAIKHYYAHRNEILEKQKLRSELLSEEKKETIKAYRKKYYEENKEKLLVHRKDAYDPIAASERWKEYYYTNHKKELERKRAYYDKIKVSNPQMYRNNASKWRQDNPEKVKAHREVARLVKNGELKKPEKCSGCNCRAVLHAHHEDYEKPNYVIWLCKLCHAKVHRK